MTKKTLSHQIEAIEYVHADDGLPYRHDFTRGDSDIQLRDDGSVVIRNRGKRKLWDVFTVKGKQQPFLVNPRGTRDTPTRRGQMAKKRKATKRRRNAPAAAARRPAPKRRRRRNGYNLAANPPRRRRSRHRRNPPFNVNGIIRSATDGLIDGALVTAGKGIVRFVSFNLPYEDGSLMDSLAEIAAAVAMGLLGPKVLGADRTRFLVAGGFSSPMEVLLAQAQIGGVSHLFGKVSRVGMNTALIMPAADGSRMDRVSGYSDGSGQWPKFGRVSGYNTTRGGNGTSSAVLQSQGG